MGDVPKEKEVAAATTAPPAATEQEADVEMA